MPLSIKVNLRVTGHCNQGGRKYMEDMFSVAYQQTSDDKDLEYAFFGIFDGHGGGEAATFAKEHLMDIIVKQRNFWSDKDEDVLRAIRDGYVNTHYAMWRELEKWPRTASGLPSTAGTTASVAFIRKGKIYIGHVGDSGIILGYQDEGDPQWKAKALTKDHKPESFPELVRIQESGGKVVNKSGVPRVVWNRPRIGHKGPVRRSTHIDEIPFLAVARSLGDLWSYNSELDTFVVSPEPDVKVVTVDVKSHRCLIFGTDGLWNMLTPQAAVAIVQAAERHNEKHLIASQQTGSGQTDIQMWINPSKSLVDRALEKWSSTRLRADNTSVVTLMLDPPGPSRSEVLMSRKTEVTSSPKIAEPSAVDSERPIVAVPDQISSGVPRNSISPLAEDPLNRENPEANPIVSTASAEIESIVSKEDSIEKDDNVKASTSGASIQVPEISSSDTSPEEIVESVPEAIEEFSKPEVSDERKIEKESETPDSCSKPTREVSEDLRSDVSSPSKYPPANETPAPSVSGLIRQNSFCGSFHEDFKSRPRLRRTGSAFGAIVTDRSTAKDSKPEVTNMPRRRQSQGNPMVAHLESRTVKRRQSVNATSSCLVERQKSYFGGVVGSRTKREISYLGISRDHRKIESMRNSVNPTKVNRTAAKTTTASTTNVGSKRRHSSTSEPTEEPICSTQEPVTKRRTRSEDRPGPIDENDPANQEEKQQKQEQHSRLRWPEESSVVSTRQQRTENLSRNINPNNPSNVQDNKLTSPNSFQRRSLEKKATPVKTIRRPSINGSNRVQFRGSFALREWDQSESATHRTRLNRTIGVINPADSSPPPNLQRWLRSDTLAATPVKTLRSRNVDIDGHTVPAQIAHQYGVVKPNRLSLPAKIKISGKVTKISTTSNSIANNKLSKQNQNNSCNQSNNSSGNANSNSSAITKRVKSPYNTNTRSALGTRSRLKRLSK